MKRNAFRKSWMAVAAGALALWAGAPSVQAATDPLFVFTPEPPPPSIPPKPIVPPPTGYLFGPCGLAVDSSARLYVSDYHHHAVNVFSSDLKPGEPAAAYVTQLAGVDPLDGPCGLALNGIGQLFVNNYHRNVERYEPAPSFGSGAVFPLPEEDTDHHLPTGVAVSGASVYVNHRAYVSVYESSGAPVEAGGQPLRIGVGSVQDGYSVAVSTFPGTFGRIYVPDAGSNTVKAYDPATSTTTPVATIKLPGNKPFTSLRDSAIAVDRVSGDVYVADNNQPAYTERPQATVHVFNFGGAYKGHLKYNVITARPPGLAVDNSALATQGRVYVTSGNSSPASVYAYGPGSATTAPPLPPTFGLSLGVEGSGQGSVTSSPGAIECAETCERGIQAGAQVSLTATPAPGSTFAGWSHDCSGSGKHCTVTMDGAVSVRAEFTEPPSAVTLPTGTSVPGATAAPRASPRRKAQRRRVGCRSARKRRHRYAKRKPLCRHRRARSGRLRPAN